MNNTKFLFLQTQLNISLKSPKVQQNMEEDKDLFNTKKRKSIKMQPLIIDELSINKLQSIITESINYHQDLLSQLVLPEQIDIQFTQTNKLEKFFNQFLSREYTANTTTHLSKENNLIHPIIRISTDFLKNYNQENKEILENNPLSKNKFLHEFRLSFAKSQGKSIELMTELTFLHELSHIHLNQKYLDTILISGLLENNNETPLLTQLTRNIQESFCDGLSTYLTSQKYPQIPVLDKYERVRIKTLEEKNDEIYRYDTVEVFSKLKDLKNENVVEEILKIAIKNGLNILKGKLSSKNMENKLRENLKTILNKNFSRQDLLPTIKDELLKYNPVNKGLKKDFVCHQHVLERIEKFRNDNINHKKLKF